jgi:hypothetical protein
MASKTRPRESASSAALRVTTSLSLAHLRILVRDVSWRSADGPGEMTAARSTYVNTERHVAVTSVRLELLRK